MQVGGHYLSARWSVAIAALALLGGCTTTTITATKFDKPSATYSVVALADVTAPDDVARIYLPYFRRGFTQRMNTLKGIDTVVDPAPSTLPAGILVVSGRITEVDEGSRVARMLVGFGAGRSRVGGNFEIHDDKGAVLAQFESGKAYSGGAGIGGMDLVSTNDLMEKFGQDTADAVWRWSRGRDLDGPAPDVK